MKVKKKWGSIAYPLKIANKLTTQSVGENNPNTQPLSAEVEFKLWQTFGSSSIVSVEVEHRQFYF